VLRYVPLLFVLICVPLAAGLVPPNSFYGFRVGVALASEPDWYRINAIGGIVGILAGGVGFLVNRLIARSAIPEPEKPRRYLVVLVVVAMIIVVPISLLA